MRHLIDLIGRFRRDDSGNFAIIFGLIAVVLVAMSGAVVDFTSVQQARTKAQVALDAAALALQPSIYTDTPDSITDKAEALLLNRLADGAHIWGDCTNSGPNIPVSTPPCVTMTPAVPDKTAGSLALTATLKLPMSFVSLVGVNQMQAAITSVATRQKLNLEVAMVLDNSGSMSTGFGTGRNSTRLTVLQTAANCAANILFYDATNCDSSSVDTSKQNPNVKMALVPFNDEVNVGASYALAHDWLDRTGAVGSFANDNFATDNNDTPAKGVDRVALFQQMSYPVKSGRTTTYTNLTWGGCVEARYNDGLTKQYDTDDTPPDPNDPQTLFVPLFAPDEPDSSGSSSGYGYGGFGFSSFNNSYISDTGGQCTGTAPTSQRTLQERLCKYYGARLSSKPSFGNGPNVDCPASAIVPLTDNVSQITTAINGMVAAGNTNIQEGTAWGFRVLSPTEPFTEGLPYDQATSKVMIVMTDGENTYNASSNMNGASLYAAYAYPWDNYKNQSTGYRGRMGNNGWSSSDFEDAINARLATTCANAKAAGITIYTIGLATNQTSNPTGNHTLLTNCATNASDAYFPPDAASLVGAFEDIAKQLAALRLSQ